MTYNRIPSPNPSQCSTVLDTGYNLPSPKPNLNSTLCIGSTPATASTGCNAQGLLRGGQILMLSRPNGGIYCANTCTSRTGVRTQGHLECSDLYCKKCCQEAARLASQKGTYRAPCQERKHRLPGAEAIPASSQTLAQAFTSDLNTVVGSQPPIPMNTVYEDNVPRVGCTNPPTNGVSIMPSAASTSNPTSNTGSRYAMPLATMWQEVSNGWLSNHKEAAQKEDERLSVKKSVLASQQIKRIQLTTISWTGNGNPSIILPIIVTTFPDFCIGQHPELTEVLSLTPGRRVEAYDVERDRWDCHGTDTIRQVESGDVLLFRTLPSGIAGRRLRVEECPGLAEEIERLNSKLPGRKSLSPMKKRGRDESDDLPDLTLVKQPRRSIGSSIIRHSEEQAQQANQSESFSCEDLNTRDSWSPPPVAVAFAQPLFTSQGRPSPSPSTSKAPVKSSEPMQSSLLGREVMLKDRPFCRERQRLRGGERIWPGTFYAVDVIEGFEKIEELTKQRRPRVYQNTAFEVVYGLRFAKSTFTRHHKIYRDLPELVTKYKDMGRTEGSSWLSLVREAERVVEIPSSSTDMSMAHAGSDVATELDHDLDFNKLCPYCDEHWPENPSERLMKLRSTIDKCSTADPGPWSTNPHHRRVIPAVKCASLCSRHRFETTILGHGISQGWPKSIDFHALVGRIEDLQPMLEEIVADPSESTFYQFFEATVQELGTSRALGTSGRYRFVTKYGNGTGYYGEKGYMIISRILQRLFSVAEQEEIHGIPNLQFLGWVLLPEVVVQLIKEDLKETTTSAVKILENSFAYGNEMFSYDDDESDNEELGIQQALPVMAARREKGKKKARWVSVSPLAVTSDLPSTFSEKGALSVIFEQGDEVLVLE